MGDCYGTLEDNRKRLRDFPEIDSKRWERELNRLFPAYVFFKSSKSGIEIWTSCCGEHRKEDWIKKTMGPGDYELRSAAHNQAGRCPCCGRAVTYKNAGRLGKKKSLIAYIPAVILTARDGDLYARAYWCRKNYASLTAPPDVYATNCYIFSARDHSAEQIDDPDGDCFAHRQKGRYNVKERAITEPFTDGGWAFSKYCAYHVMNMEELEKSDLRYCQWTAFRKRFSPMLEPGTELYFMRFLTIAAIYPDKTEMLEKSGLGGLVTDLAEQRKKHAAWFNWDAAKPKDAFRGIDRAQLREITGLRMTTDEIDVWYRLREQGITPGELHGLWDKWQNREIVRLAIKERLPLRKLVGYLKKQHGKKGDIYGPFITWKDYLKMAAELGWSTELETVRFPPRLRERHDEALAEIDARRERQRREKEQERLGKLAELREKNEKSMKARRRKYNFSLDGWFIRIAETGEEIILEGRTLGHCVGGYAERHMLGATTILFLRREDQPETSVFTIEMEENRLRQIHGKENDIGKKDWEKPEREMAWLLEPWLDWVNDGSPRDRDGKPIVKGHEEVKTA